LARRAADLRNFQVGPIRQVDRGSVGEYALHVGECDASAC